MAKILDKVVQDLVSKGHSESEAWAITRAAIGTATEFSEAALQQTANDLSARVKAGTVKFTLPETKDINGVEIFAAGKWNGDEYTEKDLDEIITAFSATKGRLKPYLKLGHDSKQKLVQSDGLPSLGWVDNLRKVGKKLVADFKSVPAKIHDLISRGGYRRVSSEIYLNLDIDGQKHPKALKAVSLLGGDTPAVQTLDDIISLYASNGEVKAFETDTQVRTYELEKSELSEKGESDMTIEELKSQLADAQKLLSEANAQVKTLNTEKEESAAQLKKLTDENEALKTKSVELEKSVEKFTDEANKLRVTATVDKLITDKNILPAQKTEVFTVLMDALKSPTEKKFSVKAKEGDKEVEKEVSHFDFMVSTFSKGQVDVNTATQTGAGERQTAEDALIKKAHEYIANEKAEGRVVSFKDALAHVSPEDKRDEQ